MSPGSALNLVELIKSGHFSNGDKHSFRWVELIISLEKDPFCVCADFADYYEYVLKMLSVDTTWGNREEWNRRSLINIARSGFAVI